MVRSLADREAHVYCFPLAIAAKERESLVETLSADEVARFSRLIRPQDREHYSVARGMLRRLLSRYLAVGPRAIVFELGPQKKPFVAQPDRNPAIEFNLSHSHGWAALAVARAPVGMDIEVVRNDVKVDAVAGTYFTASEQSTLFSLPADERHRQFFRLWTRKEAFLKGLGAGFTVRASSVSIEPRELPASAGTNANLKWLQVRAPEMSDEAMQWRVCDWSLEPELTAALAFRGQIDSIERLNVE